MKSIILKNKGGEIEQLNVYIKLDNVITPIVIKIILRS